MKKPRAKLTNDSIRTFHYNTRSSLRRESRAISDTDKLETSDAIVESKSRVTKISNDPSSNSDILPIELIMEILKRLPIKTLTRFLCVSKLWASTIRRPDFTKLLVTESSKRPGRVFFTFKLDKNCFFFSSNQTQNPDDVSVATYHLTHPVCDLSTNSSSLHGLLCYVSASGSELVVYNSTTKQTITLPKFDSQSSLVRHMLGYEPKAGVYKVLCMTRSRNVVGGYKFVLQVLTLGNVNEWRVIEDWPIHRPLKNQICIDGVLYYDCSDENREEFVAMSFDLRSEKFGHIQGPDHADCSRYDLLLVMISYEGKLAIISNCISANGSMCLWILEDVLKHKWLKKVFVLPNSWTSLSQPRCTSAYKFHRFVNVTDAGELILVPSLLLRKPYYVLYYDPRRNSVRKVVVEGIMVHKDKVLRREEAQPLRQLFSLFSSQVESLVFP